MRGACLSVVLQPPDALLERQSQTNQNASRLSRWRRCEVRRGQQMGRHVCLLTTAAFSIHSAGCGTVRGRSLAAPCLAVQLLVTAGGVLQHRVHGAAVAGAAALWRLWPRGGKQRPVEERCNQRCAGGGEGEEEEKRPQMARVCVREEATKKSREDARAQAKKAHHQPNNLSASTCAGPKANKRRFAQHAGE